jgi:hypothetical protein
VGQQAPGQQNPSPASQTLQANIRPHADDLPLIPAARVWLTQADYIIDPDIRQHGRHYIMAKKTAMV